MTGRAPSLARSFSVLAGPKLSYEEGLEAAKIFISSHESLPEQVRNEHIVLMPWINVYVDQASASELIDPQPPGRLIEQASRDPNAFAALKILTTAALERDAELLPEIKAWLAGFLRGDIKTPKGRGRPPKESAKTKARHSAIFLAVAMLEARGLTATRNETNKDDSKADSACDAVAEAMTELRINPASFDAVKRVWFQGKKRWKSAAARR